MAVRIKNITIDCTDPYRLSQFWRGLTGFAPDPAEGNAPDDPEALLLSPDGGPALLFIAVPERKQGKNRVHLDLVPTDRRRDEEVDRLLGLGGRVVDDQRRPDGTGWVVCADPEGNEFCIERSDGERSDGERSADERSADERSEDDRGDERPSLVEQLSRASAAVGQLISRVRPDQWSAPTPCTEWTVRRLVDHLIGMNRVFAALLADRPPPRRNPDHVEDDPAVAYRDSAAHLQAAFELPGVLDRVYRGPLGAASGAERLQIRLYDLVAHGWDLAQATGQSDEMPEDVAELSLAFVRNQLTDDARGARFGRPQPIADDAPAIERLVAFLGRPVPPPA